MDQYKLDGKGSEWHHELTPLNIIFQYKLFNKCYYELHSRTYIYSCLELIEFIFSISQFGEMMVGTFCILLVLNELFTVSSMCQVIKNSKTVLLSSTSLSGADFPFHGVSPDTGPHGPVYHDEYVSRVTRARLGVLAVPPPPCYIDHRQEHSGQPGHLNQGILPPPATSANPH